jgi:hypothetical protein
MNPKKKEDPILRDLENLKKDIIHFNHKASLEEQQKELKRIANKVLEINKALHIDSAIELTTDVAEVVSCVTRPFDFLACALAMGAIIDELKMAKQRKMI